MVCIELIPVLGAAEFLQLKTEGRARERLFFKARMHTPMHKLVSSYNQQTLVDQTLVDSTERVFLFRYQRIDMTSTPTSLLMKADENDPPYRNHVFVLHAERHESTLVFADAKYKQRMARRRHHERASHDRDSPDVAEVHSQLVLDRRGSEIKWRWMGEGCPFFARREVAICA